jgi:hypothetical protein
MRLRDALLQSSGCYVYTTKYCLILRYQTIDLIIFLLPDCYAPVLPARALLSLS